MDSEPTPREVMAREWGRWLEKTEMTPQKVVGGLIAAGAEVLAYLPRPGNLFWNPTLVVEDGERRIHFFTNDQFASPNYSAEALRVGLAFALRAESAGLSAPEGLNLVPYPRPGKDGQPDNKKSRVLIFNDSQVERLRDLLSGK